MPKKRKRRKTTDTGVVVETRSIAASDSQPFVRSKTERFAGSCGPTTMKLFEAQNKISWLARMLADDKRYQRKWANCRRLGCQGCCICIYMSGVVDVNGSGTVERQQVSFVQILKKSSLGFMFSAVE